MNENQYRSDVLNKLNQILMAVQEDINKREKNQTTVGLRQIVGNTGLLVTTLMQLNDPKAFAAVADGLDEVLESEFFSQIHGPREEVEEEFSSLDNLMKQFSQSKPEPASAEMKSESGFTAKIVGLGNPNDIPKSVRLKLAQTLRGLGIPESEINEQLNLGGF